MRGVWAGLFLVVALAVSPRLGRGESITIEAPMPPLNTDHEDAYLCTSVQLPNRSLKLTAVEAQADPSVVHHILLFGCQTPAQQARVWPCHMARPCGKGTEAVLFGWGKGARPLQLPNATGYSVGPGTGVRTAVLQVHYLPIRPDGDASGVRLTLSSDPTPLSAGMLSFASNFAIPPGHASFPISNECCYGGIEPLAAFGVRVHTHWMGRSVYIQQRQPGETQFAQAFAQQDPQLPQGFYSISPQATILPGDRLRVTCQFDSSNETKVVRSGHRSGNEMCNLYLMVHSQLPHFMYCVDGRELVELNGAGSLPASGGSLVPETRLWQPPVTVQAAAGDAIKVDLPLGQISGVAAGRNGTLWVLHRGGRAWVPGTFSGNTVTDQEPIAGPCVLQLEQDSGKLIQAWGSGVFLLPHTITEDWEGNIWVTDVGLHQALKFSPDGRLLLALGRRLEPGHKNGTFCKPTQVAVGRDGTLYVADGYCNSRIAVFDPRGQFLRELTLPPSPQSSSSSSSDHGDSSSNESKGGDAGVGGMLVPHALALDECRGLLFVADRENKAVHAFSTKSGGRLLGSWDLREYGLPYGLAMGPYGLLLALVWDRDGAGGSQILVLDGRPGAVHSVWKVPGVNAPHALALTPAPLALTGAGERLLAAVVSETRPPGLGPSRLHKLVFPAHQGGGAGAAPGTSQLEEQQQPAGLEASHVGHAMLRPVGGDLLPGDDAFDSQTRPANAASSPPGVNPSAAAAEGNGTRPPAAATAAATAQNAARAAGLVAAAVGQPLVLPQQLAAQEQQGAQQASNVPLGATGHGAVAATGQGEERQQPQQANPSQSHAPVQQQEVGETELHTEYATAHLGLGSLPGSSELPRESSLAGAVGTSALLGVAMGVAAVGAAALVLRRAGGWGFRAPAYHQPHDQGPVAHVA